ncbi:hypothetical protein COB21_01660 [Candidatus Aerophobetes bacterium]|uniref:NlpC/P60 domain-containing protein n=1 Tax=Aerophobetes bacterium TaxID=2030807 RepID=A0A2A4X697_UNCAE|nr:MAG: hypothetical protein COB21_01660 [Candidatus Aerophobetes bacterium]
MNLKKQIFSFFLVTLTLFLPFRAVHAHTLKPCAKESKFLINVPVLNLHEECNENSPFVSQGIYGHTVQIIKHLDNGWALIETEDAYQGLGQTKYLIADDPVWKTSTHQVRVNSVAALLYPCPDTAGPALMSLPFGARCVLYEDLDSNSERWQKVSLLDGTRVWVQRGDVETPKTRTLEEMFNLSYRFLERPYIWGGTSSKGFDCSGYVQTLAKSMGIILPRDSRPQAGSNQLAEVTGPAQIGDITFWANLGKTRITHVGIYCEEGNSIHSSVKNPRPGVAINTLPHHSLVKAKRFKEISYSSTISPITPEVSEKMTHSWQNNNPIPLQDLCYIQLNHWGFDGCVHEGEIIVHKSVAGEVTEIFEELFANQYPIEKMLLVDAYSADDALSCEDNNSSCFCSRPAVGKNSWSFHSFGLAIDINPLLNPYQRKGKVIPSNAKPFLDRSLPCKGIITTDDLCYQAFINRGWRWGGHWEIERDEIGCNDYQHFYKEIEGTTP